MHDDAAMQAKGFVCDFSHMFEAVLSSLEECLESKFLSLLASKRRLQVFELFDGEDSDLAESGPALFRLDLSLFGEYFVDGAKRFG